MLSIATGLPKVAKEPEGAQHNLLAIFGNVGHLRTRPECNLLSHAAQTARLERQHRNQMWWPRPLTFGWPAVARIHQCRRTSREGFPGSAVFTGPVALSTATGLPKVAKMAEGAQHFLLAIFVDVGHLRRPIIRASLNPWLNGAIPSG